MSETLIVYNDGGRGLDYWTDDAVEGQIRLLNNELEMLEYDQKELERQMQLRRDSLQTFEAEIAERWEAERMR